MNYKILNAALILTSVIAYLEWGKGNSTFLLFAEADLVIKLFSDPTSVLHPFTIIPLAGQLILLFTLFQKRPSKLLTLIGITCIGLLLVFIFIIGIIGLNIKIAASALPFVVTALISIRSRRRPTTREK